MEYKQIFELFFGELIIKLVENLDIIDIDILENKRLEIIEEKFKKYREEIGEEENLEEEKIGEKLQEIASKLNIERELTEKLEITIKNKKKGKFVSELRNLQTPKFEIISKEEFLRIKKRMREIFGEFMFSELELKYPLLFRPDFCFARRAFDRKLMEKEEKSLVFSLFSFLFTVERRNETSKKSHHYVLKLENLSHSDQITTRWNTL
uniref:Uncharacterized protein n=1 Tax=Meloidogyne enterolobii TaxID=390850 RepID=A0A6V7VK48_MELEN|nr:unnamed protein product [Meloidogyne enterolobii]